MHSEVLGAWNLNNKGEPEYLGQGVTITVVDDFNSLDAFFGNLAGMTEPNLHGEWTLMQAGLIAPSATMVADEFTTGRRVKLADGFNVLNLSYGMYALSGYGRILWGSQEASIISYAEKGQAVISKAAGNDAVAVGTATGSGLLDYLARDLIGAQSAIFVGALDGNGTVVEGTGTGTLAWYSNTAGLAVDQFLVVGVESGLTGLAGKSFAAPIISGYAAVLSSKFPLANSTQVVNQLLDTARMDTLVNLGTHALNAAEYGQGEASIFRALAPVSIN